MFSADMQLQNMRVYKRGISAFLGRRTWGVEASTHYSPSASGPCLTSHAPAGSKHMWDIQRNVVGELDDSHQAVLSLRTD